MKYLNKYNNISSYNSAKQGDFELPHVSLINDTKEIKYDPIQSPGPANNEIWYTGEYYDLEDAISKFSAAIGASYAGPSIVTNELVGNKYVITFGESVTKLGVDETADPATFYPIFTSNEDFQTQCNITSIALPDSVTNIGDSAFYGCSGLTSIIIPNNVTSIGNNAFAECSGLTSVTISNSVTRIGEYAFYGCSGLTSVTIPNGVTQIGNYAFEDCSNLTSITIPNSVTNIGDGAFSHCSSLTSPAYNAHVFAYLPTFYSGAYTIPDGIGTIAGSAFYNCPGLTSIAIPNSVTSIRDYAFENCSGLTSVTIPNSITRIGIGTFENCSSLTYITIPNSVTSVGNYAFFNCSSLTSITCNAVTPPELESNSSAFYETNKCPIYVPSQSVATYKSAQGWSNYSTRIQAIPS